MWVLLRDFSRRWWPVYPVVLFFAVMAGASSTLPLLLWVMFAGPVVLSWDAMRGALKVQGTLPIPKRVLGNLLWFEGAVLFPLVCAPAVLVIEVFLIATGPETLDKLAETAFLYVLGMGLSSFMFLLLVLQPVAPTDGFRRDAQGLAFGGLWGSCLGGSMLLGMRVEQWLSSPWGTLALAPAVGLIVGSFLFAGRFASIKAGARTGVTTTASARGAAVRARMPSRWTGFATPWFWEVGFACIMGSAMLGFSLFFSFFSSSPAFSRAAAEAMSPSMVIFLVVIVAAARPISWLAGVRALRALPLSRLQLALLYLSLPVFLFCAVLGFAFAVQAVIGSKALAPQMLVLLLPLLGICFLCNVLYLRTGSLLVLFIPWVAIFFAITARPFHSAATLNSLVPAVLICLAFIGVSFFYLNHLLGNSSDAYRQKPFVPGQLPLKR